MSKSLDYPRKSFATALKFAEEIDKLGGKCTIGILAEKLGKKVSGAFKDSISSCLKHGFITKNKDELELTPIYTDIRLSYSDEEKNKYLKIAFLKPSLYSEILKWFNGKKMPMDVLDKMLIREYNVSESYSNRIANYIKKGAESVGIIQGDIVVLNEEENVESNEPEIENNLQEIEEAAPKEKPKATIKRETSKKDLQEDLIDKVTFSKQAKGVVLNINIQLTVPETTNEEVYDKFFASMKRHLLS